MEQLLFHACGVGDVDQVIELLSGTKVKGLKANSDASFCCSVDLGKACSPNESTVFHLVCAKGNVRTFGVLLKELERYPQEEQLAILEQREIDKVGGCTPLHHACASGNLAIVRRLLELGVDPDLEDRNCKFTPLHIAIRRGHFDVARELVSRGGADINARDVFGNNAAYWLKELFGDNADEQLFQIFGPPRTASIEERFFAINQRRVKQNLPISSLKAAPNRDIASYKALMKNPPGRKGKKGAKLKSRKK